jgi:2-oxoisovalerate dehydrogenase E1 component beta subunit
VPEGAYETPLRANTVRDGDDLVIIAYGAMVHAALEAAAGIEEASVRVLDLRTLVPLDERAILDAVRDCAKVVVVDEANQTCAAGAQVASLIAQYGYGDLDGPVVRVATPDAPIPFAPALEHAALPGPQRIRDACRELLAY